jgi:hypothetical protein
MINILFIHQSAELYGSDKTDITGKIRQGKISWRGYFTFRRPLKTALKKKKSKS